MHADKLIVTVILILAGKYFVECNDVNVLKRLWKWQKCMVFKINAHGLSTSTWHVH